MTKALVPFAEGAEEMEAVIAIDTLRRGGWEVTVAGLAEGPATASRGVRILPDLTWEEADPQAYDYLVLPGGGPGTERLAGHAGLLDAIRQFDRENKGIAAICAAPTVLKKAGILEGKRFTCHPAVADQFGDQTPLEEAVVEDGNLVTSRGPGTSFSFALKLIEREDGIDKAREIASAMVLAGE